MNIDQVIRAVADETNTNELNWTVGEGPQTGVGTEYYVYNDVDRIAAYVCVDQDMITTLSVCSNDDHEPEYNDDDGMTDMEADAQVLAMAGMGTDEDYGVFHDQDAEYYHDHLERDHDEPYMGDE